MQIYKCIRIILIVQMDFISIIRSIRMYSYISIA